MVSDEAAGQKSPGPRTTDSDPGQPPAESQALPAIAELEDRWRRAAAEADNLRKRFARDLARERDAERASVARALLPVLDDLERALEHAGTDPGAIVTGIEAVRDHAIAVLGRLGYPRDDETGVPFDPLRHEVVSVVDDAGTEPGTVVQVLRPGYGKPDRQLRPGTVAVSKGQE